MTIAELTLSGPKGASLALEITQVGIDATNCGIDGNSRSYTISAEPYPFPTSADCWRVSDNYDGELVELDWNSRTRSWDRSYLHHIFEELMASE